MPYNTASVLPHTKRFAQKILREDSPLDKEKHDELTRIASANTHSPRDQKNKVEKGNLVEIDLNGKKKEIIIDGVKLGPNPHIVSENCPLAKAIMGQKVGFHTNFKSETKVNLNVRILKIGTFEDAKEKLFPKQKLA